MAFSLLGLAGAGTARLIAAQLSPIFLVVVLVVLARAHYLIHTKKHGTLKNRIIVWLSTIAAAWLWAGSFI